MPAPDTVSYWETVNESLRVWVLVTSSVKDKRVEVRGDRLTVPSS